MNRVAAPGDALRAVQIAPTLRAALWATGIPHIRPLAPCRATPTSPRTMTGNDAHLIRHADESTELMGSLVRAEVLPLHPASAPTPQK